MGRKFWTCGLIAALSIAAACSQDIRRCGFGRATDPVVTANTTGPTTDTPADSTPANGDARTATLAVASGTDSSPTVETSEPPSDEADTDQGEEPRWATGDSDYLFDQEQLHTFEITLTDDALAELDGDPTAEEYVEGSLTFDGETVDEVGVRYKGSIGAFLGCTSGTEPVRPERCEDLHEAVDEGEDQPGGLEAGVLRRPHRSAPLPEPRPVDDARAARVLALP